MEQETKKRARRSRDQIVQDKINKLESRIVDYENKIAEARKEIEDLKNPPAPIVKMKDVQNRAEELGVTPEELMSLLEKASKKKNKD